jgi:ABC-type polysaccharide/polyol phosphate export permease
MMENLIQPQVYDSSERGSPPVEELRSIFKYRHLLTQFVRRDILTRYKRSVLGVAWTMLNPLGTMLILTIVFSRAFGGSQPGYAAYVLSGLIAWNFFAQSTNAASLHLVWGGSLIKKIYIPRTIFALSATGTGLVNLLLSLVPLLIVMLIVQVPIRPTILLAPIPILFLVMFALGLGLLISTIAVYFTDVVEMYAIILMAWMYLTPIIYSEEILPEMYRLWIVRLNPMYHLVELFRAPLYEGRVPSLAEFLISGVIALTTLLIGWLVFTKNADEFAYRI